MRKKVLAVLLGLALLITSVVPAVSVMADELFKDSLEGRYMDPERVYSSDIRWWIGDAAATDQVILDEIQAMYDGGFRGVELCMQDDEAADDSIYGYGSEMWAHKWSLMMNKLLDLGMSVYLTSGTNWATSNVPASSLDPASEAALQVLAISNPETPMLVAGGETYTGIVELPAVPQENTRLNTVYAYKVEKTTYGNSEDAEGADSAEAEGESETTSEETESDSEEAVSEETEDTAAEEEAPAEDGESDGDSSGAIERTAIVYGSAIKLWDRRDENSDGYVVKGDGETDYTINWTAPDDGQYEIIATWSQGAYHSSAPGAEPCYTTNYFDERGVEALRSFWEEHYLNDPELVEKIKNGDVQLFMDSLELTYGDGFTWWCEDAAEQFEAIKGYDPMPYIIMVDGIGTGFEFSLNTYYDMNGFNDFIFGMSNYATYMLAESDEYDFLTLREQLVNDWQDVMTQLYETRMLAPLKNWLNGIGIRTRAQISYGKAVEITEPSAYVDYPEAENLNQYNNIDILRLHTGGAKLQNKVLSTETGGNEDKYAQSFSRLLNEVYTEYAAGFQRVIWHIWTSTYGYGNWAWPGYLSGMDAFYRWGNREPSFVNYDEFNAHIGRIQKLMQTGRSRTDIAFIHNNWAQGLRTQAEDGSFSQKSKNWQYAHEGVFYRSTELQDHGYTYDYVSPDLLVIDHTVDEDYVALPGEVTKVGYDPETGVLEGAGYKAIVIYQDWMDPDGAEIVLDLAKQGMPVVILENAAQYSTFVSDVSSKGNKLSDIMEEMKGLDNVRVAAINDTAVNTRRNETGSFDDDVYEMLLELCVKPYAGFDEINHQLLTQTREDESGNRYMYLYNYCPNDYHEYSSIETVQTEDHGTNCKTEIKLDGVFVPYIIDSWSGEVTELAQYSYEDGCTIIPVDIDYANIELFAFEAVPEEKTGTIIDTDAAFAYMSESGPMIRVTEPGNYKTVLSDGTEITTEVGNMAAKGDITGWNLDIVSWTAGEEILSSVEKIGDLTTENKVTVTEKTEIDGIQLDTIAPWNSIDGLGESISGTGTYTAQFEWESGKADGAYIDFGETLDQSMTVYINDVKVGGTVSEDPAKASTSVTGTIFNEEGEEIEYTAGEGRPYYTGGVNWDKPVVDIGKYLQDGTNTITVIYNSSITNAALAAGIIEERGNMTYTWYGSPAIWWGSDVTYRANGPSQAVLIPYRDIAVLE